MYKISMLCKRVFDIFFSLVALIVLSPIFLILPVIIKLDSKGTVFFKQNRRGLNGRIFTMYKFRSMTQDAEQSGAGIFNYKGDPRITRVGQIIRNTSLDELPQLVNVLKGDMSLVGPRPCVTYELGDFNSLNKKYRKRFQAIPGITGLAQVSGRNNISWEKKVELDNEYIDKFVKWGIFLDLWIIYKTILKVFTSKNIYEEKLSDDLSDQDSARLTELDIIRKAHEYLE